MNKSHIQSRGADYHLLPSREQVHALLFAPLPELNPPGFSPAQLAGLRALPEFCGQLKLVFALRALEPLTESPLASTVATLTLTAELLAAVGNCVARNSDLSVAPDSLLAASTLALHHLRPRQDDPAEEEDHLLLSPEIVLLEAAELIPLRRALRAGTSEELICCAAGMLVELWQLAEQVRQSPGSDPEELTRAKRRESPASEEILRKLAFGCAVGEVLSEVRGGGVVRAFGANRGHRPWGRGDQGGRAA